MAATGLSACGSPTRSEVAVCHIWDTDGLALHNRYTDTANQFNAATSSSQKTNDAFAGLFQSFGAIGDIAHLMDEMATVAPSGIEDDFQILADMLKQEGQSLSSPMQALVSGLTSVAVNQGAITRVNNYLEQCPAPKGSQS